MKKLPNLMPSSVLNIIKPITYLHSFDVLNENPESKSKADKISHMMSH